MQNTQTRLLSQISIPESDYMAAVDAIAAEKVRYGLENTQVHIYLKFMFSVSTVESDTPSVYFWQEEGPTSYGARGGERALAPSCHAPHGHDQTQLNLKKRRTATRVAGGRVRPPAAAAGGKN